MLATLMLLMFGFPNHAVSLETVRTVYVDGTGEITSVMRAKIKTLQEKYGSEACFSLDSRNNADALFVVSSEEHASGINALLAGISTTVISGEVDSKGGSVLWPQTWKAGSLGLMPDSALKSGAARVLESLYKSAGCDKTGRRRLAQ